MNMLDFVIVIVLLGMLARFRQLSAIRSLLTAMAIIIGILFGLVIATHVAARLPSYLYRGLATLGIVLVVSALFSVGAYLLGSKLRLKILLSRFANLDSILGVPVAIVGYVAILAVTAQILPYVPMLSLQYEAQGSAAVINVDRYIRLNGVAHVAQRIAPDQFHNLVLKYDPEPITYNQTTGAGDLQTMVDAVAPSVVKVSGNRCTGLGSGSGFIAAPGFIVTNAHVAMGASTVYVRDHNGTYPATPIIMDKGHDLAILYSKYIKDRPLKLNTTIFKADTHGIVMGYPGGGDLKQVPATILPEYTGPLFSSRTKLTGHSVYFVNAEVIPAVRYLRRMVVLSELSTVVVELVQLQ